MNTGSSGTVCREVEDALSQVLEGSASASLYDHIAGCDACRDLRHEATLATEMIADAGADFRAPEDFGAALAARLEAALIDTGRVSGAKGATPSGSEVTEVSGPSTTLVMGDARVDSAIANAATTFAPLAGLRDENITRVDPPRSEAEPSTQRGGIEAPAAPVATVPEAPVEVVAPAPVAVATPFVPTNRTERLIALPRDERPRTAVEAVPATTQPRSQSSGIAAAPAPAPVSVGTPHTPGPVPASPGVAKAAAGGRVVQLFRRRSFQIGLAGTMVAAAAAGFMLKGKILGPPTAEVEGPWSGTVAEIARASADKSGGLDACNDSGKCWPVAVGATIKPGTKLKTDSRTRAHLKLGDGTELSIDRGSEVELPAGQKRTCRVEQGTIVADVAHLEKGPNAHFTFARGEVEVIGTKLAVTAEGDRATVEVARGQVRVKDDSGKWSDVRAGEEATLLRGAETQVASSTSLADVMEWSDRTPEDVDAPVLRGLGELRARKPGQTQEKDRAVRLSKHAVKVRVVDVVARTEVDETFSNDTDEELEGIFRFPLPPGAQIEKLSLEVDGKLLDGAFVDREKGAAIWRGVIQNAAPKTPRPREEIIWVPGPWRDPALLEWQRGGRFELKIFPIPKKGSRRVVLTYTQTVEQAGGIRRFTYPLAHDQSGTTKVDSFDLDLQVLGGDKEIGLKTRGYELTSAASDGAAERRVMHADNFVPAGDLTVEYALPDRNREVTAWAYKMDAPPPAATPTGAKPATSAKPQTPEEKAAAEAAAAIVNDTSPYVTIAVRPKLPRWQEAKGHVHVLVVDSSRSMVGERYARATRLASSIVREMDRRDSFVVLACDTLCRPMTASGSVGGSAASASPAAPGASAAGDVERFLGSIEPDGGSDLAAAMSAARAAAGSLGGKELRVIYLGDGTPSVGPTTASHLEVAVRNAMPAGDAAVVAVALGADADTNSLQALARGGGGVFVSYVPGQKVSSAALDVLGAAYGVVLRDPEIELPAGLSQVTPARLDPIRAGGETFIVARMSGGNEVAGTVKLRGRVAGEKFEQTYPLKVVSTTSSGNAFVPRMYAAAKIADLERAGGDQVKPSIIELSRRFAVASRYTSLLVLESEAMFNAFGLDRTSVAPSFTGELSAESSSADADGEAGEDDAANGYGNGRSAGGSKPKKSANSRFGDDEGGALDKKADRLGSVSGGAGRSAEQEPNSPAPSASPRRAPPADAPAGEEKQEAAKERPATKSPAQVAGPPSASSAPAKPGRPILPDDFNRDRGRRLVPMKKIFERHASFDVVNTLAQQSASKLTVAEAAIQGSPDSRDKTVELFALYATSGRLGEAQELTAKWSGRDALDPDAITARADLAARQGDRDRAVRILGGLADVRPNDKAPQVRLAELQEAAGNLALACEHRIALADMAPSDAKLVADAVRCARNLGSVDLASLIKTDAPAKVRESVERLLSAAPTAPASSAVRGDVQVTAEWNGGGDLDIALIDAQGRRISWLGSPSKTTLVSVKDPVNPRTESLGLTNLPSGSYVVEVSRAGGNANDAARGEVTLRLAGETRKIPFALNGSRAEIGTVKVFFTSRLVPVEFGWRF